MVLYMAFHALFITQIIALVVIDRLIYVSMRAEFVSRPNPGEALCKGVSTDRFGATNR